MTEILDLCLLENEQRFGFQFSTTKQVLLDKEISKFRELVIKSPFQRRQWRPNTVYYFQLDNTFTRKILSNLNKKVKVVGVLTLLNTSFNLCFLLVDELNNLIKCRSKYHKILLSKFCLQLNSNLQHFRLKVNSVTGEIGFHFQLILENIFFVEIEQIVLFALNSYQQQIAGHLYTLKLLQFVSQFQNQYLANISQTLQLVKIIVYHKNKEFQSKMYFGQELKQLNRNIMPKQRTAKEILDKNLEQESKLSFLQICDDFFFDEEQTNNIVKDIKTFLIQDIQGGIQMKKEFDGRSKLSLQVKKFYQKDKIFSINLIRKAKLSNVLSIQIKKNKLIQEIISNKKNQNILGTSVQQKNIISLQQKYTNKMILLQIIKCPSDSALQEYYICENFTKFQSLRFLNQYVKILNYPLLENGFIALYHAPNKQSLKSFLEINQESLSLITKSAIAYHLVVIVYTIQQKNNIIDYFPSININNIQISSKYSLSLKRLVTMSQKSLPPLDELLQIIHFIFFQKSIVRQPKIFQKKYQKSNYHNFPLSSDQVLNSFLGPHNYINFIKFHIFNFLNLWQIQNKKLNEIKSQYFENKDQPRYKRKIQELNAKFELICENLMIIFGYFREFLGKQNNPQSKKQFQRSQKEQSQN